MAKNSSGRTRWIALAILAPLCGWLVYRNLFSPGEQRAAASLPRLEPAAVGRTSAQDRAEARSRPASPAEAQKEGSRLSQQELAALDPTLRVDLLEDRKSTRLNSSHRL